MKEIKTLSIEVYINKIRPCSKNIINNLKKSDTWKIKLIIVIKLRSSKDTDEERLMHSKSDNIETMVNDKADEVSFQSRLSRCQIGLETTTKGRSFIFDHVHLLCCR